MTNEELQAYMLGELSPAKRKEAEQHLGANPEAAQEAERLGTVIAALKRLPEEEPPRRIAFVSDKVFEPKWYERLWATGPRAAFASAAMLALSIVAHGFVTAPKPAPAVTATATVPKEIIAQEVNAAVTKAVAEVRAEANAQSQKLVQTALADAEKKFAIERRADWLAVEASIDTMRKQLNRAMYVASYERGGAQ
ncbi:MAG: hypothetical protein JST93_13850 [Acidobacteria bacterium]|nr:hypothetical protein [Acidobacteriota bacterium]